MMMTISLSNVTSMLGYLKHQQTHNALHVPHAQEAASNAEKQSLEERVPKKEVEKSLEEDIRTPIEFQSKVLKTTDSYLPLLACLPLHKIFSVFVRHHGNESNNFVVYYYDRFDPMPVLFFLE